VRYQRIAYRRLRNPRDSLLRREVRGAAASLLGDNFAYGVYRPFMERDQDEQEVERPRPRVVDKRVSARPAGSEPVAKEPPPREPITPEPPPSPTESPEATPGVEEAPPGPGEGVWTPQQEEQARRLAEELARAPGRDLVVTMTMNFVEVASVKIEAGDLEGAQLAIDALDAIVKAIGTRLGDAEAPLKSVLAQLQMGYAQRAGGLGAQP
jgi:hypothetical protein